MHEVIRMYNTHEFPYSITDFLPVIKYVM